MTPREKIGLDLRELEPIPADGPLEEAKFLDHLIVLVKWKWLIFKIVGAAIILAVILSLTMHIRYTAITKIMPPQQSQSIASSALSQLGPLAALAGQGLGMKNPGDLYAAMLRSHPVEDALIDRFNLMSVYKKKLRIDAERTLDGATEIKVEKEGTISIAVDDLDPKRAADLANAYVDELAKLSKTLAVTEASKRRRFFEGEMKAAAQDLSDAELALKQTQEKTGLYLPDSQSKFIIQSIANLRAQISAKEAELQVMRSYAAPENPDLLREEQTLTALRNQEAKFEMGQGTGTIADLPIGKMPTAGLEYVRKLREVKYQETLYELLGKQYEIARIDEGRDPVMIEQLDKAVVPERRSGPHRSWIVVSVTLLAGLFAVFLVFMLESLERSNEDPRFQARLQLLRFYLYGQRKN